jgi:hypothetical protein
MPKTSCCDKFSFPFSNVAFTDIVLTADIQQQVGPFPKVQITYYDPETDDYYLVNGIPGVPVSINSGVLHIDHGGPNTGFIKLY